MDIMELLSKIFEVVIIPLLGVLTTYLVFLIKSKINNLKESTKNDLLNKYLDMLDKTITECVIATNQTYVETLKKEGTFDVEAQKVAFQKTYNNVMDILSVEAQLYLSEAVGDLTSYITNKIESEVRLNK